MHFYGERLEISNRGSSGFVVGGKIKGFSSGVEVQAAGVKIDRGHEPFPIAEAARGVLDPLNLRIETFGHDVGDPMVQAIQNVLEVPPDDPGDVNYRPEARADSPCLPALEEGPRRASSRGRRSPSRRTSPA
jgi:hypothetical protein